MAVRLLVLDEASDGTCTIHKSDGTSTEYADWATFIAAETLADVETFNSQRLNVPVNDEGQGTYQFTGGTAPLTAKPSQGATERAAGQGCTACSHREGCVALIGKRQGLTSRNGIKCGSYTAA